MTLSEFEIISNQTVKKVIKELRKNNIEIDEIIQNLNKKQITAEVNKIVDVFFNSNKTNTQEDILKEVDRLANRDKNEKEYIISIYLTQLILLAFEAEKEKRYSKFDFLTYLPFVLFLYDLQNKTEANKQRHLDMVWENDKNMASHQDFYSLIEETADTIFHSTDIKISPAFAFQTMIEKKYNDIAKVHFKEEQHKALKYKPLSMEHIFYL